MKRLIIILFWFSTIFVYGQTMDIVYQQCYGTINCDDYPDFTYKIDSGYFVSTGIICDQEGISGFHGGADPWLIFTDTLHNIKWERCYGGSGGDSFKKMLSADNEQYWILGGTNSNDGDVQSYNHDSYDIWILKLDSVGNILFEKCYGSYYNFDRGYDMVTMPDGGAMILASFDFPGGDITTHYGNADAWLFRIDSVGNIMWEKTFGNESVNELVTILPTTKGTYMLVGWTYAGGGMITCEIDTLDAYKDCWILEVDEYGEILWQNCYGGSYSEQAISIAEVDDGYIVVGATNSNDIHADGLHGIPGEMHDLWVFKIGHNGELVWQNCLGGSDTEWGYEVFIEKDKSIIIFSVTWSIDGDVSGLHGEIDSDIWITKLDSIGNLLYQRCIGSSGFVSFSTNMVSQISEYNYLVSSSNDWLDGDVECELDTNSFSNTSDNWVFQLKDCNHYSPAQPQQPTGKDTLCVNNDSITSYSTTHANNAWYYEWALEPTEVATISQDSLTTTILWNPNYEGPATIKVRSSNDCGESAWSDSLVIQTYMCLGTEENPNQNTLRVYPNPTSSTLFVELKHNANLSYKVEVYNSIGTKVHSVKALTNNTTIDVSNWNSGIYIVKVLLENDIYNKKIVVR